MAEIGKLLRKRSYLKGRLTSFKNFKDEVETQFPQSTPVDDPQVRRSLVNWLNTLKKNYEEFDAIQQEIEAIAADYDEQVEEHFSYNFEDKHIKAISWVECKLECAPVDAVNQSLQLEDDGDDQSLLSHHSSPRKTIPASELSNSIQLHTISPPPEFSENIEHLRPLKANLTSELSNSIRLPTISLPKFSGNFESWLEFRDIFVSLIHSNDSISEVQKFHYLRASLKREAALVIESLEFSAQNYKVAWETLCHRYDNSQRLLQNHVKAIFDLPQTIKENAKSLRNLVDSITKHLRTLETLGQPVRFWDPLLIHIISNKLDSKTSREWESHRQTFEIASFALFKSFLEKRANILEMLDQSDSTKQTKQVNKERKVETKSLLVSNMVCPICKENNHMLYSCSQFQSLSVQNRFQKVKDLKYCINCLKPGHSIKFCKSGTCRQCGAKHHTLLHRQQSVQSTATVQPDSTTSTSTSVVLTNSVGQAHSEVLLATALVNVRDKNNAIQTVRVILDAGSQSSFITSECCKRLGLQTSKVHVNMVGLNDVSSTIESQCQVTISSKINNYQFVVNAFVVQKVSGALPKHDINIFFAIQSHLQLADPRFYKSAGIDMLIGADHFWQLLEKGQIKSGLSYPILQETKLGWIVSGPFPVLQVKENTISCHFSHAEDLNAQMQRFWDIEECGSSKVMSAEEEACETHFVNNHKRDSSGRFIVALPLKLSREKLGDSKTQARKRFLQLEYRLAKDEKLRHLYSDFMNEYIFLNHMTAMESSQEQEKITYFMPHHGVFRENSLSTKLRVVFNASAPTTSGLSLNDLQLTGPTIQDDLFSIILRFRKHRYVVSADIAKMYRQIFIEPSDRNLQLILWRNHPSQPIQTFQLNTVTYGTTAAPFLAIRCLEQLAKECEDELPEISEVIRHDFYVDDMLTGSDSVEHLINIRRNVTSVLAKGCFELRKWISNNSNILAGLPTKDPLQVIPIAPESNVKTLGLAWSSVEDAFLFPTCLEDNKELTKRILVSTISKVFDPLGLIGPCIMTIKILIQNLWQLKISWDELVPFEYRKIWLQFCEEFSVINELKVPRHVVCNNPSIIQLHGFCDASEKGYGACIYIRSISQNGDIFCRLLCAKSRVAPIKRLTIPRLELCAAYLLSKLFSKVLLSFRTNFDFCTFWSDSTIVLGWLNTSCNMLKTFVGNRVAKIQHLTKEYLWRHVNSNDNPADYLSRGTTPNNLKNLAVWWKGPKWLSQNKSAWPSNKELSVNNTDLFTEFKEVCLISSTTDDYFLTSKYSNLNKIVRIVAYCLRFGKKLNNQVFSVIELTNALKALARISQRESFGNDITTLRKQFGSLNPIVGNDDIIRVGGRLIHSTYSYDKKHPILLSGKHPLSLLIMTREHVGQLHCGPQQLLSHVREQFWIIGGRNLSRKIVRTCVRCFKVKPRLIQPQMADLPKERVTPAPPFAQTGVDFAGPLLIRNNKGRGSKLFKCYICVFVCLTVKAVHLELVTDLSTDRFILSLRRFIARRGKPIQIHSDNGRNFVGAKSEMKKMKAFLKTNQNEISSALIEDGIEWKFIPPHAPHFGGLWERAVRSCKTHLLRVAGDVKLTFEEISTLLVQIEAIMNSRPLTPMSTDPNDLSPLTPAHFLIGRPLTSLPERDLLTVPSNRLNVFQLVQKLYQHFWRRWQKEYLSELQQRRKWFAEKTNKNISVGDMVLLKDENLSPLQWRLGRVVQAFPSKEDKIVRVVDVKTSNGILRRPVVKLCPLPVEK